jgi:transcriptional regulator with XRE-family HTH domain
MLSSNIAKMRKRHGLTQIEFAKKLHVTQSAVSHWESGRSMPDTTQLFNIAQLFGMTVDALSSGTDTIAKPDTHAITPPPAQEKAPSTIDEQIMRELEGADVELVREVLNFIRFRKQGGN